MFLNNPKPRQKYNKETLLRWLNSKIDPKILCKQFRQGIGSNTHHFVIRSRKVKTFGENGLRYLQENLT